MNGSKWTQLQHLDGHVSFLTYLL